MIYIATFYSHFGAIRFKKMCEKKCLRAKMMPVPRNLSSSCGTCVKFEYDDIDNEVRLVTELASEEIEQIVAVTHEGYRSVFRAENS